MKRRNKIKHLLVSPSGRGSFQINNRCHALQVRFIHIFEQAQRMFLISLNCVFNFYFICTASKRISLFKSILASFGSSVNCDQHIFSSNYNNNDIHVMSVGIMFKTVAYMYTYRKSAEQRFWFKYIQKSWKIADVLYGSSLLRKIYLRVAHKVCWANIGWSDH